VTEFAWDMKCMSRRRVAPALASLGRGGEDGPQWSCTIIGRPLDQHPMHPSYVPLPHQLTARGWMVFHRIRCEAVASRLTPPQARTLADALNLAATGEAPRSARVALE
jgi:hypothetical protein